MGLDMDCDAMELKTDCDAVANSAFPPGYVSDIDDESTASPRPATTESCEGSPRGASEASLQQNVTYPPSGTRAGRERPPTSSGTLKESNDPANRRSTEPSKTTANRRSRGRVPPDRVQQNQYALSVTITPVEKKGPRELPRAPKGDRSRRQSIMLKLRGMLPQYYKGGQFVPGGKRAPKGGMWVVTESQKLAAVCVCLLLLVVCRGVQLGNVG
eukprot:Sspe_Gene.104545::Locus_80992_Transcript_1_1_Confidence_1.000_Length_1605::g.104545::m.104545